MTSKKPKKTRKVKAWAVITDGKLISTGMWYKPLITTEGKGMAMDILHNDSYFFLQGDDKYLPKVIPITITYTL